MRHLPVLAALTLLAACSSPKHQAQQTSAAQAAPSPLAPPSAPSSAPAIEGRKVGVTNALIDFDYSYPVQAAAIPKLKAWLDADIAKQKQDLTEGAEGDREDAKKNGFPAHQYSHTTAWKVVTEIPGWLSLSAERWEYTGGAHGNPWSESLLWDKAADTKRDPLDLFMSKAALSKAIRAPFCAQIDQQREEKRGEPVNRNSGDEFDQCIDPVESTVILGSSDHQHFDRVGVLVGPYVAGPYVEGEYEATLPVTPAVLAAVKPEYRQYFALGR